MLSYCLVQVTYLDSEGIITNHKHGFVGGRSCLTNLLYVFEDWTSNLDEGYGVDVIYLDYKKAFDTHSLTHSLLRLTS